MDRNYILKIFPEIRKIKSRPLRSSVVHAWLIAIKREKWKRIDDIPFTLFIKTKKTLIQHTRSVTQMAMAVARIRDDVDMDTVIAGGLVHDIGKLLEYTKKGSRFIKSSCGKRIRHPISGYGIALEAGLSAEIAHIIAAHSVEGDTVGRSREAILIHHCDFIDFDIAKSE